MSLRYLNLMVSFLIFMISVFLTSGAFAAQASCYKDMDVLREAARLQPKGSALNQAIQIFNDGPYRGSVFGDDADAIFTEPRGTILLTLAWLDGTAPHLLTLNVCEKDGKLSATDQNGRTFSLKTTGDKLIIRFGFFSSTFTRLNR